MKYCRPVFCLAAQILFAGFVKCVTCLPQGCHVVQISAVNPPMIFYYFTSLKGHRNATPVMHTAQPKHPTIELIVFSVN